MADLGSVANLKTSINTLLADDSDIIPSEHREVEFDIVDTLYALLQGLRITKDKIQTTNTGTAGQVLKIAANGTDLEWADES